MRADNAPREIDAPRGPVPSGPARLRRFARRYGQLFSRPLPGRFDSVTITCVRLRRLTVGRPSAAALRRSRPGRWTSAASLRRSTTVLRGICAVLNPAFTLLARGATRFGRTATDYGGYRGPRFRFRVRGGVGRYDRSGGLGALFRACVRHLEPRARQILLGLVQLLTAQVRDLHGCVLAALTLPRRAQSEDRHERQRREDQRHHEGGCPQAGLPALAGTFGAHGMSRQGWGRRGRAQQPRSPRRGSRGKPFAHPLEVFY